MPSRPPRVKGPTASASFRPPSKARVSAACRGYDATWRKVRLAHLRANPVCVVPGCGKAAMDVDHIVPIRAGGGRLDQNNLQSLCHSCHSRKTARTPRGGGG